MAPREERLATYPSVHGYCADWCRWCDVPVRSISEPKSLPCPVRPNERAAPSRALATLLAAQAEGGPTIAESPEPARPPAK